MTTVVFVVVLLFLIAINVLLWKFGFVTQAERPRPLLDRPFMDEKERKAILKRLERWKSEGKLTLSEYDHFYELCRAEWDTVRE